jgi:phosphate uptake regulator
MKRKVVQQGATTLMISLPSKWARKFSLKKGDEVDIEEQGNNILVSPEEIKQKLETEISITGMAESSIRTIITNTYRLGYDRIRVNFSAEEQFKIIQNTIKTRLLGFDIIKKEKNSCIIENITEPSSDQFENLLQKVFMNIEDLFEISEQRLKGEKPVSNYMDSEERIQQYDNFCRRVITKKGERKSHLLWTFLALIIHGQRDLYHLNKYIDKTREKDKEAASLLIDSKAVFDMIVSAYAKKNLKILEQVHDVHEKMVPKIQKLMKGPTIYYIASSMRNFYLSSSPLIGWLI